MKRVGILALQGDFEAHGKTLARAGAEPVFVRTPRDLGHDVGYIDGLIIPGGESTTMLKLLRAENMIEPLAEFGRTHPIFGTCAGVILLAKAVSNPAQESLGLLDLDVERNGYGRQIDSRVATLEPSADFARRTGERGNLEAVFIRAPIIHRVGPDGRVLAEYQGNPVLVEQGRHLAATFHPELTSDLRVHELFLSKL
ncbi:MAG: pyridoxal 5'-phosphate synthase glutaminase subunit PdxT [Acidobacteriota bacterium]|nr:pyridoxal 5'-phosphate synthase glutaminase subunit PdxT [Acidobacteriota bacterium]